MGGANTVRSNEDEKFNPLEELCHTMLRTNIEKPHHPRQGLDALNTVNLLGRRPDIQLLYHTRQTTNTTFWDCRPDVSPLELEPQRRTTQPLAT
jgi:hypothetical protein